MISDVGRPRRGSEDEEEERALTEASNGVSVFGVPAEKKGLFRGYIYYNMYIYIYTHINI